MKSEINELEKNIICAEARIAEGCLKGFIKILAIGLALSLVSFKASSYKSNYSHEKNREHKKVEASYEPKSYR